jgi:hypothetical protein
MDEGFSSMLSQEISLMISDIRRNAVAIGFSGTSFDSGLSQMGIAATKVQTNGRSEEDIIADVQAQMLRIANAVAATLPGLSDFALYGEDLFATVQRLGGALRDVNDQFALVGKTLVESTAAGADWAYQLQRLFGGSSEMANAMDEYFEAMYTDSEKSTMRATAAQREVNRQFEEFGITAPTTLNAFNELRNSITDPELFAALTLLGPTFATMVEEATKLAESSLNYQIRAAEALRDILTGPLSVLNPTDQYNQQKMEFEQMKAQALSGDQRAMEALPNLAKSFLETSRNYNASGSVYQSDFESVTRSLATLSGMPTTAEISLQTIQRQLNVLEQIRDALNGGASYAVGTDYVPYDMTANIHQGEMVIDQASSNVLRKYGIRTSGGGDNKALVAELKEATAQLKSIDRRMGTIETHSRLQANQR